MQKIDKKTISKGTQLHAINSRIKLERDEGVNGCTIGVTALNFLNRHHTLFPHVWIRYKLPTDILYPRESSPSLGLLLISRSTR